MMIKWVAVGVVLLALLAATADAQVNCTDDADCKGICYEDKDCKKSRTSVRKCKDSETASECDQCCDPKCEKPITWNKCIGPQCRPQCFRPRTAVLETGITCYKAGPVMVCVLCECPRCWNRIVPKKIALELREQLINTDCCDDIKELKLIFKCGGKNEEKYPCRYKYEGVSYCINKWFDLKLRIYTLYQCKHKEDIDCTRSRIATSENCRQCDQDNHKSIYSVARSFRTTFMCMTGDKASCRPFKQFRVRLQNQDCRPCKVAPWTSSGGCNRCIGPNGFYETRPPACIGNGFSGHACLGLVAPT
ncbi:hypothetical protein NDN08_007010 [Rhodosorus marinus]|uniref:TNFR-Cys domain-containing protein n=1 Tax=Rhodosorus marinus TaxID=101924 RepID=A0AAV8UFA2_9RHOD|nr:hypothetical protein NDN08_007010 [Rhodosorus marinus]